MITLDTLLGAYSLACEGKTSEEMKRDCLTKGTTINVIVRSIRRYGRAYDASAKYGFVGVGCITFAEHRLTRFVERANITLPTA